MKEGVLISSAQGSKSPKVGTTFCYTIIFSMECYVFLANLRLSLVQFSSQILFFHLKIWTQLSIVTLFPFWRIKIIFYYKSVFFLSCNIKVFRFLFCRIAQLESNWSNWQVFGFRGQFNIKYFYYLLYAQILKWIHNGSERF